MRFTFPDDAQSSTNMQRFISGSLSPCGEPAASGIWKDHDQPVKKPKAVR
jgi:hypothetical protein